MEQINIANTNIDLSVLLKRIEQGEGILITRHGRAVAQLLPVAHPRKRMPSLASFRNKISSARTSPLEVLETLRKESR